MISVTITDKDGSSTVQTFDEKEKEEVLIGRVKGNDIVLPKTNVSKRHSRIIAKDGRAILVDLKSTNGTFVNGQKILQPRPLAEGDKVFIGDFQLEVRVVAGGAAPAAAAPVIGAPMPSFGAVPGVGGAHAEAPRPGIGGGLPSLGGAPNVGGVAPVGTGLPSLGGVAPVGPGVGISGAPAPGTSGLGSLPPVGAPAPMGPGAGLGVGGGLGAAPAPVPPAAQPAMSPVAPMGPGAGLGASPNVSAPHGIGAGISPLPAGPAAGRMPGVQATGESQASMKPASEGVIDKSLRASSGSSVDRSLASAAKPSRKESVVKAVAEVPVAATLPEDIIVDDSRNPQSEARIKAARIVMDAYLGQVDFQSLVSQPYPPEPEVQDACYARLANIANANRAQLGNVNIDELLEFLLREACGLGAIDALIDDEAVTDFTVYNFETIIAERSGRREISALQFTSADTLYLAAQRILSFQGLTEQTAPAVSEVRLGDGTQIQVVMAPVSVASTCIVVRKTCRKFSTLPALVQKDVLSNEMAKFLLLCVKARRNILIVGAQGSGRTSILNALGSEIPNGERIITVENSAMMLMPQLYVMSLEAQNSNYGQGSDLASLIRSTAKLRAERVLVDTLQVPAEASAFVGAIYAGAQGSMATINGLNGMDGLNHIDRMTCSDNVTAGLAKIARALDIVVTTRAFSDGRRRIVEIAEVAESEEGRLMLIPVFEWKEAGMGKGSFKATGNVPAFFQALERGGVSLEPSIFNV